MNILYLLIFLNANEARTSATPITIDCYLHYRKEETVQGWLLIQVLNEDFKTR